MRAFCWALVGELVGYAHSTHPFETVVDAHRLCGLITKTLGVACNRLIGLPTHGMGRDGRGHRRAAMTKNSRDGGERLTIGEHQAGTGMAQVVKADRREICFLHQAMKHIQQAAIMDRATLRCGKIKPPSDQKESRAAISGSWCSSAWAVWRSWSKVRP